MDSPSTLLKSICVCMLLFFVSTLMLSLVSLVTAPNCLLYLMEGHLLIDTHHSIMAVDS